MAVAEVAFEEEVVVATWDVAVSLQEGARIAVAIEEIAEEDIPHTRE